MGAQDVRSIKSAHRVLEILEFFDLNHRTATVMDLSRALGYPQSSTSELLRCLTRLGYLHYNRYRRTYGPTARVALLGSWVEPSLFRGGAVLTAIDRIAQSIGETVLLSTAANYIVQHLHVVVGEGEDAVIEHAGAVEKILHNPIGRLILSSFNDQMIRSALHRLNAEEDDPSNHVRIAEEAEELRALRSRGWIVDANAYNDGTGVVSVLLPLRRGTERLALSVRAKSEVIEQRASEIIWIITEQGGEIIPERVVADARKEAQRAAMPPPGLAPLALVASH